MVSCNASASPLHARAHFSAHQSMSGNTRRQHICEGRWPGLSSPPATSWPWRCPSGGRIDALVSAPAMLPFSRGISTLLGEAAMIRRHVFCVVLSFAACAAHAAPIANSISDFSNVQGQNGWFYGFFNQGVDGSTPYTTGAFEEFTTYGVVLPDVWGASAAQVGAQNNVYLGLGAATGHPTGLAPPDTQDRIIWAVRRYVNEVAGDIDIAINLRKENLNANGGGVTGRVFVDGVEIRSQFIAATDGTGLQTTLFVPNVAVNALIDFAIDPLG